MKLSIKAKLTLSLCAIAAILLISATISVLEYSKMSTYVSDLIADDVKSLNTAHKLSLDILAPRYNIVLIKVWSKKHDAGDLHGVYRLLGCQLQ